MIPGASILRPTKLMMLARAAARQSGAASVQWARPTKTNPPSNTPIAGTNASRSVRIWPCQRETMEYSSSGVCLRVSQTGILDFQIGIGASHSITKAPELVMDRDVAIRLDGMLIGVRGNLDGIAHYMKNNLSPDEFANLVVSIGSSMGELIEL